MYKVPKIVDPTGTLSSSLRKLLLDYLMGQVFYDNQGQKVTLNRATVTYVY
jgi:hypothetical protein